MLLRGTQRQAEAPSESIHPSAASVDSQTVKASEHSEVRGYDGGKEITGIKRHIAVDTLGLLLAVSVTAASVDDAMAARTVFQQLKPAAQPKLEKVWADSKYHNHDLNAWLDRQRSIQWDAGDCASPVRHERILGTAKAMDCGTYLPLARTLAQTQSQL